MKTIVVIDDKDHAMKQLLHEFPKDKIRDYNFIHFDTFKLFKKQKFHKIDIIFLDFFLSNDQMFGKEIISQLEADYLVCFSSKKEMSDAMANEAVKNQYFKFENVYSVQKIKNNLDNAKLNEILIDILNRN